jgi:hypothetical protein
MGVPTVRDGVVGDERLDGAGTAGDNEVGRGEEGRWRGRPVAGSGRLRH